MNTIAIRALLAAALLLSGGLETLLARPATAAPDSSQIKQYTSPPLRQSAPLRNSGVRTYTGTVTKVRSKTNFSLRVGSRIYTVSTNYPAPQGLSVGDIVRVSGQPRGRTIRRASSAIMKNG